MGASGAVPNQDRDGASVALLPMSKDPFPAPTDRDMLPSERRLFVRTHRTCIFGYGRRSDGPAMSVVYYVPAVNDDLFVSPLRDDGTTFGTPTQTWALIVDGDVYVRAANGPQSRWYQAAMSQKAGRVRVADKTYDVMFEPAGAQASDAIDVAYEAKYPGSTAVPIMQGDGPKSATVRIVPR